MRLDRRDEGCGEGVTGAWGRRGGGEEENEDILGVRLVGLGLLCRARLGKKLSRWKELSWGFRLSSKFLNGEVSRGPGALGVLCGGRVLNVVSEIEAG